MAVGQIYTTVEEGWQRINPANSNIEYYNFNGTDTSSLSPYTARFVYPVQSNGSTRNNEIHVDTYFPHKYATAKFNFTGSKLRIIMGWPHYSLYKENVSVYIDGVYSGRIYTADNRNNSGSYQHYWCGFEKTDLANKEHTLLLVVEPKSGTFHLACVDIDENGTIKASTLINKNQIRTFTGESDSVVNKIKEGKIITAKYIEINKTVLGYFSDFKLSDFPVTKNTLSGSGNKINIAEMFEYYQQPDDPAMYEITEDQIILKETRNINITNGTSETIDPSNYKEIFGVNTQDLTISAIPNDIILKTKKPISYDLVNCFSGISYNTSKNDISVKFLLSINDGVSYFTFDDSTSTWSSADVSDIDSVGITNFTTISYSNMETFLSNSNKVSVIMKIGLEPVELDIDKYEIADRVVYNLDYTTGPAELSDIESCSRDINFYFTNAEGTYDGNEKYLVCDTVLSKGMSWNTADSLNTGIDYTWSNYDVQAYMQLIDSKQDDDDYTTYVESDPKFGTNIIEATWVNNGATIANNEDFIARGDSNTEYTFTSANKTTSYDYIGVRPRLYFNSRGKIYHRFNSEPYLPIVKKVADLAPGKAIACTYTAKTSGTPSGAAGFKIGKNGKSILPDYGTATPDGYFYFICVGYAPSGALKCIADRNIQTNVSWEALNNLGYCVTSGVSLKFGSAKNCLIRLPNTVSQTVSGRANLGEWDECISYYGLNGIIPSANDVWNASSSKSWTLVTPVTNMSNRIIRGAQDETTVSDEYTQENVSSNTVNATIGFRPVIEIQTFVDETDITTYPECDLKIAPSFGVCKPGQAVMCEYKASSGTAGSASAFNFNPVSTKDPISDPAPAAPDGKFYFVCVGYAPSGAKKFVADRNIQTSISWEALNNVGYCVTSGVDVTKNIEKAESALIRLMISDVTNYDMPLDSSEWDAIIMKETIGDTNIPASGCHNWNMNKTTSWMLNTPHSTNAAGNMGSMSDRVVRGKENLDYSIDPSGYVGSSTASATVGFRPVLEVRIPNETAFHNVKINTTHVYEKNTANHIISMDGSYEFFDDDIDISKCSIKLLINDLPDVDFNPTLSLEDRTYHYDLALTKLSTENGGDNVLMVILTTVDIYGTETENKFEYHIIREKPGDLTKSRDHKLYTAGFDQENLSISNNTLVNNTKSNYELPTEILIPNNTINITFTAED